MDTIYIPTESDFKRWVKEAMKEITEQGKQPNDDKCSGDVGLMNRKEIAGFLRISLVTLNHWIKRGLPSHKQRGRVYFDKKEIIGYIKERKARQFKLGSKLYHLKQEIG